MSDGPAIGAHERPSPRPGLMAAAVDDELFLYDPSTSMVQRLNATAAAVWRVCDGNRFLDDVVGEVATRFGERPGDIAVGVIDAIAGFAAAGLLEGAGPEVPPVSAVPEIDETPPPAPETPSRTLGPYRALDRRVVVAVHDSGEIADELERILEPLLLPDRGPATDTFAVWHDDGWRLDAAGNRFHALDESVIADFVMFQINWLAFEHAGRHFVLHAGVVAKDGRAVVLPATANSGKSTLATALVHAGFDYLSDEAAAIDLDTGTVYAHPKPITLDPGSHALFADLDPGRIEGRSTKWYVPPDSVRPDCVVESAELAHLVFPTYTPGGDSQLVELGLADAAELLLSHTFDLAEHGHRLADIVALAERSTCHTIEHDGLEGPVAAISALL